MKTASIERFLQSLNKTANTWILFDNLKRVILLGDGNLDLNFIFDKNKNSQNFELFFDTNNEFLKMRKMTKPKLISSRFSSICDIETSKIIVPKTIFSNMKYPGLSYNGETIRNPKAGDIIFTIDSTTKKQIKNDQTVIDSIIFTDKGFEIVFKTPISSLNNKIVCWAIPEYFNTAILPSSDESVLMETHRVNNREFDVLIMFANIGGFELFRELPNED